MTVIASPLRTAATVAVVVVNAVAQGLLVVAAPQPRDPAGVVLAILSVAVLATGSALLWMLAQRRASRTTAVLVAAATIVVVACALAAPFLIPVVVALICPLIGAGGPAGAWRRIRRHPWRSCGMLVATAAAVLLAVVLATAFGLLLPGAVGAALAWALIGAGAAALTHVWTRWAGRPAPGGTSATGQP